MDARLTQRLFPVPGGVRQQRIFLDAAIQSALDQVLADIPDDKTSVLVRGKIDRDTIATVVAAKGKDSRWSVALLAEMDRATHALGYGFEVRYAWPN